MIDRLAQLKAVGAAEICGSHSGSICSMPIRLIKFITMAWPFSLVWLLLQKGISGDLIYQLALTDASRTVLAWNYGLWVRLFLVGSS